MATSELGAHKVFVQLLWGEEHSDIKAIYISFWIYKELRQKSVTGKDSHTWHYFQGAWKS